MCLLAWPRPAAAQDFDPTAALRAVDLPSLMLVVAGCVIAGSLFAAWISANRARRTLEHRARRLEASLDEAATLLAAEPHLLYVWQGKSGHPARIVGDLREMEGVPGNDAGRLDFDSWLSEDSARRLRSRLEQLRASGAPFNIVVHTAMGELLEADGRAAGGLATLRLRMLTGERLEMATLAEDYRQLEQQAEALTAILDRAPVPIWIRDAKGAVNWVNAAYAAAVDSGSARDAIAAGAELIGPDDRARLLSRVAEGETARRRVHAVIGGARRALDVFGLPIHNGSAGIALDVTELEEAQDELTRHIQAHASTLDKIATAVAIFGADQRLRFCNAAYRDLWGLDADWLDERPSDGEILDRLRDERRLQEHADYRTWRARWLDAYTRLEDQQEWWHLPDGRTLRVLTEQHPFGGVTHLYENVTEQLNLESRYNALIGVQRETLDNLHEGVALFGSDGRLKLFNPAYASIWQLDERQLAEEPHIEKVIDWCRPLFDDAATWDEVRISVTALEDERRPLTIRLNRPDGTVIDFFSVPLPDGATLLTHVDVTDSSGIERALRERNDALETADRLKTEFMSHVSYELRTPLTNIIGFTESLRLGIAGEMTEKQREYTGDILSSSKTLLAIIDDILDLATIDAGVMELHRREVDLGELLHGAAGLVQDRIRKRGLSLEIEVEDGLGPFQADERRIKQVLFNLLSNAIGFSERDGVIRMGARRDGDAIVLWIADTGAGIEPERHSSVFDRFETRSGGSEHRGAGLGLSIVKSFVELHGGTISLDSSPNEGTTIICCFPVDGRALADAPKAVRDADPSLAAAGGA